MKLSTKILTLNLLASLLYANSAMARIQGVRSPGKAEGRTQDGPSRGGGQVRMSVAEEEKADKILAVSEASCSSDIEEAKYYPQELFQHLTRDGNGLGISVRDNKVIVAIPPIINVCGRFVPELKQNPETKNVTVLMKLVAKKDGKDVPVAYKEFEDCLAKNEILVDGQINHDKLQGKQYSENVYSMTFDFDKKKDVEKTVSVTFGYPKEYSDPKNGYKPLYGLEETLRVPGESCMLAEKVDTTPLLINKGQDVIIQELIAVCKTGDAQQIAEARKSLGNADALSSLADKIKDELDAGYLVAVKTDVKRIDEEMKKIEDRLSNLDNLQEPQAKKEISKYEALVKELDQKFLNPAIYRLETMMAKRATLEDDHPEIRTLDEEIAKLNEDISTFSKRNPASFSNVYSAMEKFALNDSAKNIEDIRLKSFLYGKVYVGNARGDERRGKPLSFEQAQKEQVKKLQSFERVLTDWNDQYLVSKGNTYPIQKAERERQASIERMNKRWNDYTQQEYKDYNSYCAVGMLGSVKNPVKCKEFMSGMQSRQQKQLKRREQDLYYIKGRNEKLQKMGTNYNQYQQRRMSEMSREEEYSPYGSSYTSYEDNFADRFPGYYGPSTSTAYDPSMYNMGGMNAGMQMMGQQNQYGQMMMNPMMGQSQQGMMMNQGGMINQGGMMGGWPSL